MSGTEPDARAFIRALRFDHLGEVSTEANFRLQAWVTFDREVRAQAHAFADLEARTRDRIAVELAKYGVTVGKHVWLRWLTYLLLLPLKLVLPTRIWLHLIYRSTLHAMKLYEGQRARFDRLAPEFFEALVAHEVEQRDWTRAYLARPVPLGRRLRGLALGLILLLGILGNGLAYFHARAMTHFVRGGERPKRPQDMTTREKLAAILGGLQIPRPTHGTTPEKAGLVAETERFATDDDLTLEAWRIRAPAGAVSSESVLLFHGYGASRSQQVAPAAWFHARGAETLLVDFRGSGGSDGDDTSIGVHEANDVARAVDFNHKRSSAAPILFGTSMGAVAILRAASELGVEPRAAILEQPFGRLLSTVEKRFGLMGLPTFPGARLLVFWGGVQQGFSGFEHLPVEYAKKVHFPVLLLAGEADPTITLAETREIYDDLAGPKRLVTFPGAQHESLIRKDRAAWEAAVGSFLDEVERAPNHE